VQITTVRYRKLVSGPGYENKAVEAEAIVEHGETPEDALLQLSDWVHCQLNGESTLDRLTLRCEIGSLHRERQQLRGAVAGAEAEVRKLRGEIDQLLIKREKAGGEPALPF
jgi:hypothetical protein